MSELTKSKRYDYMTAHSQADLVHEDRAVVSLPDVSLHGLLAIPADAVGIVALVHPTSNSCISPRNRYIASVLGQNRLASLLIDVLSFGEDRALRFRIDTNLLKNRLGR